MDGEGEEMFGVYLRRRSLRDSGVVDTRAGGGTGAFEDTRERTSVAFGIRLCGAPGSPTMLIVSGRRWGWGGTALGWSGGRLTRSLSDRGSTVGKAFGGGEEEISWGWEKFMLASVISVRESWAFGGDQLRFVVTQELL